MAKNKKHNVFLLSWDMTGLETVIDISSIEALMHREEQERILKVLSSEGAEDPGSDIQREMGQMVTRLMMRARANAQRHYEIYTIQTTPGVTEQDMWDMFNKSPQYAADLIRERGNKLYSDRVGKLQVIS